jgi:hypothetical protein
MAANRSLRAIRYATIIFYPNIVKPWLAGPLSDGERRPPDPPGEKMLTVQAPVGHARYPTLRRPKIWHANAPVARRRSGRCQPRPSPNARHAKSRAANPGMPVLDEHGNGKLIQSDAFTVNVTVRPRGHYGLGVASAPVAPWDAIVRAESTPFVSELTLLPSTR